ncbi:MAG: mannose-1-phosphate guanylyltransferase, partial [Nitrospira sp.]
MARASGHIPHLYTVIMAGGSGTRFWPLSRHHYPKQLLKIINDETMIQQTMRRSLRCTPADRVLISTTPAQADSIRVQLGEWTAALTNNYVIEPEARNTAPAIALAATEVLQRDPDAIMLMVPADHVIHKDKQFDAAVALGAALANHGYLVTFGVPPHRPETGYGYIQPDRTRKLAGQGSLSGYAVKRFVEKPDAKTAARYLKDGNYYWNSGIFIWRATTVLEEIA